VAQTLEQLLAGRPAGRRVDAAEVAARTREAGRVLVVLDDDPTGTQSVADLPVLMTWTPDAIGWALAQGRPALSVMTNTRGLSPAEAAQRNREVARNALSGAARIGVEIAFVSRSDSTLRGHFPLETDVLTEEVTAATGEPVDGVIVVPAFGDAGRVTVNGVHYAGSAGSYVPVVVDSVTENDLRLLTLAILDVQAAGSRLVFRVGPPFPRAFIGQSPHPPLQPGDLSAIRAGGLAEHARGGLVVVGSHVALTSRRLDHRAEREQSLAIARRVSTALVEVVRRVLAQRAPRFVVAKGGITASDLAARGLGIERAMVRGPMLPGIVSLWEPVTGPARGIPDVVFAGNVGGPGSLADVVDILAAPDTTREGRNW